MCVVVFVSSIYGWHANQRERDGSNRWNLVKSCEIHPFIKLHLQMIFPFKPPFTDEFSHSNLHLQMNFPIQTSIYRWFSLHFSGTCHEKTRERPWSHVPEVEVGGLHPMLRKPGTILQQDPLIAMSRCDMMWYIPGIYISYALYIYNYIHTYVYTYIHTHIYIYIYIYIAYTRFAGCMCI